MRRIALFVLVTACCAAILQGSAAATPDYGKEIRDAVIESGMQEGAAETYNRLAEHLQAIG